MAHLKRIMYIENKSGDVDGGDARIGLVTFSKTRTTLYYGEKTFRKVKGAKHNHIDIDTGEEYWISGPKKNGADSLYGERVPIHIDADIREEYWTKVRCLPESREMEKYS